MIYKYYYYEATKEDGSAYFSGIAGMYKWQSPSDVYREIEGTLIPKARQDGKYVISKMERIR